MLTKKNTLAFIIFSITCLIFYVLPFRYSTNELDLFWSYSWVINLVDYNERIDLFFRPLDNVGGTLLFHVYPTYLLSFIYEYFGHQFITLQLSTLLYFLILFSSLFLFIKNYIKFTFLNSLIFTSLLLLMEPFLRSIISLRPEVVSLSISLFLLALSRVSNKNYVFILVGFFSIFIVESHITGIIGFTFLLISILIHKEKYLLKYFLVGFICGIFFYILTHQHFLSFNWFDDLYSRRGMDGISSSFYVYFFQSKFGRHLPEFFLSLLSLLIILKDLSFNKKYYQDLLLYLIASIFLIEILGRGSPLYLVWFFLPLFIILYIRYKFIFYVFFAFYIIQYIFIQIYNEGYTHIGVYELIRKNTNEESIIFGPHIALFGAHKAENYKYKIIFDNPTILLHDDKLNNTFFLYRDEHASKNFTVVDKYKFWNLGKYNHE